MKGRLPASERRAAVVDTACQVFARYSYRGATTAEIAREAGITEPILYRHFDSKQALYFACIDEAWAHVRRASEDAMEAEDDPRAWMAALARAFFEFGEQRSPVASLWLQALTESGDEPEVRRFLRRHLREVHDFVEGVLRRCQEAGAVPAERDARAEAWIFVAVGLLTAVTGRLGGLQEGDLERIRAARRTWLTTS
ncbi:MAG TPA: TetR/AcrR family transcriptional regulator [Gaiellaceae bacterium]|jgi:AcrR family transcriptional regulator